MSDPNLTAVHREVEDDLRRLQLKSFWDENRLWIIGTIVLAIVATAAVAFWRGHVEQKNLAATAQLLAALDQPQKLDALAADASAVDRPAHRALVRLAAAERHLVRGEKEKALEIYDALAADRQADDILRDLGRLYAVGLRIDAAPADKLEGELNALSRSDGPWRFTALELHALLHAREGRMKEAADKLAEISGDAAAPQEARTRAFTLRELYQADAAAK